jgi:hypothetical protein
MTKHPYMNEYLEKPLMLHKLKLECLQKRLALMPLGDTDYEKNEVVLEKIKTSGEIKALSQVIAEREAYYITYWNKQFLPDLEDLEENYGDVISKAREIAKTNNEVRDALAKAEFEVVGSVNIEGKIHFYKLLKKLIS